MKTQQDHGSSSSQLLVQISDTHLCADTDRNLRGINTADCLNAVLDLATDHLNQARQIIVSGDISEDGSPESYRLIDDKLRGYHGVKRYLPGNHDDPDSLLQIQPNSPWPCIDKLGVWGLIGLNTYLQDRSAGYLDADQLEKLDTILTGSKHEALVVALHHPPIPVGSPWMDEISLLNQQDLRDLLRNHQRVKAVIFGHAHQVVDDIKDGIRWLCCPSTCVQFVPNSDAPRSDIRLPGYRWLKLFDDGTIETGVERITAWPTGSDPFSDLG